MPSPPSIHPPFQNPGPAPDNVNLILAYVQLPCISAFTLVRPRYLMMNPLQSRLTIFIHAHPCSSTLAYVKLHLAPLDHV